MWAEGHSPTFVETGIYMYLHADIKTQLQMRVMSVKITPMM